MVKKAKNYKILKRGDGRFQIVKRCGGRINGAEKLKILQEAGVVTVMKPKLKEAPAPE
jgi:hypothetical protein